MKLDQSEERRSKAHAGGKAPGPSIRQSQKHATRSAIVRAARACFLASGVAKTSFDEVAERAGLSRATVYLHFSSKDQLLLGMLGEDWDAQCSLFALLPANAISPDAFALWLREVVARYQARRGSMGLYALAFAQIPDPSDRIVAQRDRLMATLGARFPAFAITATTPMEKQVDAHLMIVQIEHVCLMGVRGYTQDAVEAGIALVSRRLADYVAAG